MTYEEIVKELFRRSGLEKKQYANETGLSVGTISGILNGKKGTLKSVEACLRFAQIDPQDCLELPERQNAEDREEKRLLRAFRKLNADRRRIAVENVEALAEPQRPNK